MDRAARVVRRSTIKLMAVGDGHADLSLLISEQKNVKNLAKSFMAAQSAAAVCLLTWSTNEKNGAVQDVAQQLVDLNSVWSDAQKEFVEHLREYKQMFENIFDMEKHLDQAKTRLHHCEQREEKIRKELKKATKPSAGELRGLETRLNHAERQKQMAKLEVESRWRETETLKLLRLKEGLLRVSQAYRDVAHKCLIIAEAQQDICHELPDTVSTAPRASKVTAGGVSGQHVLQARHRVDLVREQAHAPPQIRPPPDEEPPPPYDPGDFFTRHPDSDTVLQGASQASPGAVPQVTSPEASQFTADRQSPRGSRSSFHQNSQQQRQSPSQQRHLQSQAESQPQNLPQSQPPPRPHTQQRSTRDNSQRHSLPTSQPRPLSQPKSQPRPQPRRSSNNLPSQSQSNPQDDPPPPYPTRTPPPRPSPPNLIASPPQPTPTTRPSPSKTQSCPLSQVNPIPTPPTLSNSTSQSAPAPDSSSSQPAPTDTNSSSTPPASPKSPIPILSPTPPDSNDPSIKSSISPHSSSNDPNIKTPSSPHSSSNDTSLKSAHSSSSNLDQTHSSSPTSSLLDLPIPATATQTVLDVNNPEKANPNLVSDLPSSPDHSCINNMDCHSYSSPDCVGKKYDTEITGDSGEDPEDPEIYLDCSPDVHEAVTGATGGGC